MPPSGFPHKAVAGSLIAISTVYSGLLAKIRAGEYRTLEEAIQGELRKIESALCSNPLDFPEDVARGQMIFIKTCLDELLIEIRDGKHVSDEAALEYEIGSISRALTKLHISPDGDLVER